MPSVIAQQILGVPPTPASMGSVFTIMGSVFTIKNNWMFREYNKKYWPYQFIVENNKRTEVESWCWKQFNGRRWHSSRGKFVFKKADDAIIFKLKWDCREVV